MKVEEYSTFFDVPLLRAGTFYPGNMKGKSFSYTDEELERMAADTNEAMPYILSSIQDGEYKGNPQIKNEKGIPAMVNILHQLHLKDTMKTAMKDVTVEFATQLIDGVKWLTGTLRNIPQEWAAFIEEQFPLRSIEILPPIKDPKTGKVWNKLVRGISFLDRLTMPAVRDQPTSFAVEFMEEGESETNVLTLYSQFDHREQQKETTHMPEKLKKEEGKTTSIPTKENNAVPHGGDIADDMAAELNAMKVRQAKADTLIQEMQEHLRAKDNMIQSLERGLQQEQDVTKQQHVKLFFDRMAHEHHASPKAVKLMTPFLLNGPGSVIEFADGEKDFTAALENCFETLLKEHDSLVVPVGEFAAQKEYHDPSEKPLTKTEIQESHIAEFAEAAKPYVNDPNDPEQVWLKAREMAINKYPKAF
ncbi:MAG TPA: hypothetical protein VMW91_07800 [Desulfosporosinus sp.]|nr:hypothetical protein [Desulfosporosinus sp.]